MEIKIGKHILDTNHVKYFFVRDSFSHYAICAQVDKGSIPVMTFSNRSDAEIELKSIQERLN